MKSGIVAVAACCMLWTLSAMAEPSAAEKVEQGNVLSARNAEEKALSECATTRLEAAFVAKDFREMLGVITVEWSGGCVDGKRHGQGRLSWKTDFSYQETTNHSYKTTGKEPEVVTRGKVVEQTAEGRFAKGRRVGLWCGTYKNTGDFYHVEEGCVVLAGHTKPLTGVYRKQADGSWREYANGKATDSIAAAGALEALSAKVLADAEAGKTELNGSLVVQSQSVADLVRGSKIVLAPSPLPVSLKDKRVAVLLSSGTISELKRFKRERDDLIAASGRFSGDEHRQKFIAASDPDLMLVGIDKVLRRYAKSVQPIDDLVGLQKGQFDYAFILHWKHATQFARLLEYYRSPSDLAEPVVAEQSLEGFLVNRELKAVKKFAAKNMHYESRNWYVKSADIRFLADFFVQVWGESPPNVWLNTPVDNLYVQLDKFLNQEVSQ